MATLSNEMLQDLHKGVAHISILPATAATQALSGVDFSAADELFTLKDSFSISEDEATEEEIKIDQGDATIDTDVEQGKLSFTGNCPSVAQEVFEYFYNVGSVNVTATGKDGTTYTGKDYNREVKEIRVTCLVESESKKSAILFANVKLRARIMHDNMNNPLYIAFAGTVLANEVDGVGDFAILHSTASNS